MSDDEMYNGGDSGKSSTVPIQCSALRKGQYAMLKGCPCKIVEMTTSKTGKHGHAKAHIIGIDIFTNKKCDDLCPSTHKIDCPVVTRSEYQLVGREEDFLVLISDTSQIKEDVRVPTDEKLLAELEDILASEQEYMVSVIAWDGNEKVTGFKPKAR